MPAVEVAGNFSGLGVQISSCRTTEPRWRIGTGLRTGATYAKPTEYQRLGRGVPAAIYDVVHVRFHSIPQDAGCSTLHDNSLHPCTALLAIPTQRSR